MGMEGNRARLSETMDGHTKSKRTRAKGESLDILKSSFQLNPNPSLQERNRISELTGMPEKNVRIWFQNRRAKVRKKGKLDGDKPKLHDGESRVVSGTGAGAGTATAGPGAGAGVTRTQGTATRTTATTDVTTVDTSGPPYFDKLPLNINNNYYFIDVFSITVGSWNRMKSGSLTANSLPVVKDLPNLSPVSMNQLMSDATDLMVVISKKNFEINYFFSAMANNTKILFRIFFRINTVASCSLSFDKTDEEINNRTDPANKQAELKLKVNKPPKFAVYFLNQPENNNTNQWCLCEDFSEGKQVNDAFVGGSNVPHVLKGLESSLKILNSLILDYISTNDTITSAPLPPPPTNVGSDILHPQMHPAPHGLMAYNAGMSGQMAPSSHTSETLHSIANAGGSISPPGFGGPYAALPHIQPQPSVDSTYFFNQYNPQPVAHEHIMSGPETISTYDGHTILQHPPAMQGMIQANHNPIINSAYAHNPMDNMLVGVPSVNNSESMLTFTNESGMTNNIPEFLRNPSEVNEDNRWI
ncbi:Hypothetical protein J6897_04278 [Nakaseomyces glabratus]